MKPENELIFYKNDCKKRLEELSLEKQISALPPVILEGGTRGCYRITLPGYRPPNQNTSNSVDKMRLQESLVIW